MRLVKIEKDFYSVHEGRTPIAQFSNSMELSAEEIESLRMKEFDIRDSA